MRDRELNEQGSISTTPRRASKIHVTQDVVFPSHGGQIIAADIGEASTSATLPNPHASAFRLEDDDRRNRNSELKATLRRFSKLVLAGYGGASLLFFGVPPIPPLTSQRSDKVDEETKLAAAIGSSEEEAFGSSFTPGSREPSPAPKDEPAPYSWWNILRGKHDKDILLHYARSNSHISSQACP